jgi:hypothetical protein
MQKHTPPSRPVPTYRTPSKLASERPPPAQTNIHATDKLIREENVNPNQTPVGSASILSAKTSFGKEAPGGGGKAAATGGGSVFLSKSSNNTDLPSKQRDIQPCGVYDDIYEPIAPEKQNSSQVASTTDGQKSDFWKKHELWGAVGQNDTFKDEYKTTEQPFESTGTIDGWLKLSFSSDDKPLKDEPPLNYLKNQLVCKKILDSDEQGKLVKASQDLKAFRSKSSNSRKFYWLLLRLVYASSRLADPSTSWWYNESSEGGENPPPDNFCTVLQKVIQKITEYQKVFESRDEFDSLVRFYINGLTNSKMKQAQQFERIDWIRSRPLLVVQALLGVQDAKTNFETLLLHLGYESFDPAKTSTAKIKTWESQTLEMGYYCGAWKQAMVSFCINESSIILSE